MTKIPIDIKTNWNSWAPSTSLVVVLVFCKVLENYFQLNSDQQLDMLNLRLPSVFGVSWWLAFFSHWSFVHLLLNCLGLIFLEFLFRIRWHLWLISLLGAPILTVIWQEYSSFTIYRGFSGILISIWTFGIFMKFSFVVNNLRRNIKTPFLIWFILLIFLFYKLFFSGITRVSFQYDFLTLAYPTDIYMHQIGALWGVLYSIIYLVIFYIFRSKNSWKKM